MRRTVFSTSFHLVQAATKTFSQKNPESRPCLPKMSLPTLETQVKVTSEGAQNFTDWFYRDVNDSRPLAPYYVNSSNKYTNAGVTADIVVNGARIPTSADYETLLDAQRGHGAHRVRYEVDHFDAQVLNANFALGCPESILSKGPDKAGGRVSMLVTVMGVLHLGGGGDNAEQRKTFNDVFVLVPNWDAVGRNAPRGAKKWLVMSHNSRVL